MSLMHRWRSAEATEWAGRGLVALQFGLLAWMAWRAWQAWSAGPAWPGPPLHDTLAAALLAGSVAVALWALAANRPGNFNIRPTPRRGGVLVTTGPYRWIRHPMYTAVLMAAAAAAVQSGRPVDALIWLALLAVLVAKAGIEERALVARFAGYPGYRMRTRMFLPWLV